MGLIYPGLLGGAWDLDPRPGRTEALGVCALEMAEPERRVKAVSRGLLLSGFIQLLGINSPIAAETYSRGYFHREQSRGDPYASTRQEPRPLGRRFPDSCPPPAQPAWGPSGGGRGPTLSQLSWRYQQDSVAVGGRGGWRKFKS